MSDHKLIEIKAQMFDLISNRESIANGANQAIAKINTELQGLREKLAALENKTEGD